MEQITLENLQTAGKMQALIESITRDEIKAHVLHVSGAYRLGFTPKLAEAFIQEKLDDLRNNEDQSKRKKYFLFVGYYLLGLVGDYPWRGWDENKRTLEEWKYWKKHADQEKADELNREIEKRGYKKAFIEYYKTQNLEELYKRVGINYWRSEAGKTKQKIDNKLKTKNHTLEKIEKLLDEEIELYGRHKYYIETEEERAQINAVRKASGFTD